MKTREGAPGIKSSSTVQTIWTNPMLPIRPPSAVTRAMWYATVGVVVAVIAAGAIAGYVFGLKPLTDFGGEVAMALNTAICFLLTGAAWITHALDLRYAGQPQPQPNHG